MARRESIGERLRRLRLELGLDFASLADDELRLIKQVPRRRHATARVAGAEHVIEQGREAEPKQLRGRLKELGG